MSAAAIALTTWGLYLAVGVGELLFYLAKRRAYPWRECLVTFAIVACELAVGLLLGRRLGSGLTPQGLEFPFLYRSHVLPLLAESRLPAVLLGILAGDFFFYATHVIYHRWPFLWSYHSTHHSARRMHFLLGVRVGVLRYLVPTIAFPWLVLQVPPYWQTAYAGGFAFVFFYQRLMHFEYFPRLGWLDYVFVTPSNHRVHHALNAGGAKNMGGFTVLWDHLFGTFQAEPRDRALEYGMDPGLHSDLPVWRYQIYALQKLGGRVASAPGIAAKARALFSFRDA